MIESIASTQPLSLYGLMTVDVPEGVTGPWRVERFEVTQADADLARLRACFGHSRERIEPGTYTRLAHSRRGIVMSDTPTEKRDHHEFVRRATGRVLIHGLGLGMCLGAVLQKPSVEHVTVVELDPDVISLVGPHYQERYSDRLWIKQGDALTWKMTPGAWWDYVWHDIWDEITPENLPQMKTLHRRFGRRCGWQGSWARNWCEAGGRR